MTRDGDGERRTGDGQAPLDRPAEGDSTDEALLGRLAATMGGAQDPPERVAELARLSFGLRRVDEELAELVADSALEAAPVGVRAGEGARLLTFEAASGDLEVQVTASGPGPGGGWEVMGQVVPPGRADVRMEPAEPETAAVAADADDLGRFRLRGAGRGPWRLVCRRQDRPPLVSQWVLLG